MMFTKTTITATLAAMMALASVTANAADLNIPEQPMDSALKSLSEQAQVQIIFAPDAVQGKRAPAIRGDMTPAQALQKILHNSGLSYKSGAEGTFAVQVAASPVTSSQTTTMDEVTVTATRTEHKVSEVPASVTVLTEKKLATKNRQNVYEALRDEVGLDFVNAPGMAHQVEPSIRGVGKSFAGSTAQVLVDGMPSDTIGSRVAGHGGLNFTSMQDVERVEIVRGPGAALYGPSAVGGVINVIPKRWKGEAGVEVNGSYGTHNTRTAGAAVGTAKDNFDVRLSVYEARSDGYKSVPVAYPDGNLDLGPKDWKDSKAGLMMGFRPAENHEITLNVQQYGTRSALNYGGRPNERHNLDGQTVTAGYRYDISEGNSIKANLRATSLREQFTVDSWDNNGLITPGVVTAADLALDYYGGANSHSTMFQVQLDTRPLAGNQLTAGYSHDAGSFDKNGTFVGAANPITAGKSKVDALFVQDEQKFGALSLIGGLRYDRISLSPETLNGIPINGNSSVANVVNPRLGARFQLSDSTSFYASAGTAYLPALNDLKFKQPSPQFIDNPNLRPESSTTYEIGMNNWFNWGALRTSLFHTDYKDKITSVGARPSMQYQNIAVAKVDGIEFSYEGNLGNGWKPYTNFSYTRARDYAAAGGAFSRAKRISPSKLNLGVTYEPNSIWSATLNGRAVSGLYFNSLTPAQWSGGYFIADAKVAAKLPVGNDKWEVFGACNNLTGKKYQPFNIGEWSDGRTFTIGVNGRL